MSGFLEALSSSIGDQLNELSGYRVTRLTAPVGVGATVFPVESTAGWASSGDIGVKGIRYSYTSKTLTSLDGIHYLFGGATVSGAKKDYHVDSTVFDLNRDYNMLDRFRQSTMVETAIDEELSVLGRNHGVLRLPFLNDDTTFRQILRAVAYNPRGTVYGIEQALEALAGVGNFEIYEDLINHPNKIFIRVAGDVLLGSSHEGKAFTGVLGSLPMDSDTGLTLSNPPSTVASVRWKDENHTTDMRAAKPSVETIEEYEGDLGTQVWVYDGADEGVDVAVLPGDLGVSINDASITERARYVHTARVQPESRAIFEVTTYLLSTATFGSVGEQWMGSIKDGGRDIAWGIQHVDAATFNLGFYNAGFVSGSVTLNYDQWYTVAILKETNGEVHLVVDGVKTQTEDRTSFAATTDTEFSFGSHSTTVAGQTAYVKNTRFFATTPTDYWNARGDSADTSAPDGIDINVGLLVAGDIGKEIRITGSTTTNPSGGNNNFRGRIVTVPTSETMTVEGLPELSNALVEVPGDKVYVGRTNAFQFPDDLGKQLVISGSSLGNDGTYTIASLLQQGTEQDLSALTGPIRETTNIAVVSAGLVASEQGLVWRMDPAFVVETGVDWELSNAGSFAGVAVTLRQAVPIPNGSYTRVVDVYSVSIPSAQVLLDATIVMALLSMTPRLYSYYPFFLNDPLAAVRGYIDDLTAAGVIPDYSST